MRSAEQEMFHNGNWIEIRFQRRIYIKFNNIKMVVCQMINYIIFQIVRCYIVALTVERNRWNEVMWLMTDILPVTQPEINSCILHISSKDCGFCGVYY